jgi:dihydropteroate synthase
MAARTYRLKLRERTLELGERTLVMGVLNVTPDSFSDGGRFLEPEKAVARALEMVQQGADLLDIGGESTRPGSEGVSEEEELGRVLPVLKALRGRVKVPLSIDTQKAAVADAALDAGAEIINDVSALRGDRRMAEVVRRWHVPVVLMHMRGRPRTMQRGPFARDVLQDVKRGLEQAVLRARRAGIRDSQIILDPGLGFGKSHEQNFELLAGLPELAKLGFPLLVGPSRKAFIGTALGTAERPAPPEERVWGTAAAVTAAILGGAHIVRVHDVAEMAQVARVADRIRMAS